MNAIQGNQMESTFRSTVLAAKKEKKKFSWDAE